jgi:hypothetical protein
VRLKTIALLTVLISGDALALHRWVPPPAPRIQDGTPIQPEAEIYPDGSFIIHLPKPEQVDWRQTRYVVELKRNDEHTFSATLKTDPFARNDEVFFLTIPKNSKEKYELEVIDRGSYPFVRVFKGNVGTIKEITE